SAPVGTTAFYQVTAVDLSGNESAAATISATRQIDTTPPAPPVNLVASPSTSGIRLDWANNMEVDLAGYNVYRSDSFSGDYVKLNTSGLLDTSDYFDTAAPEKVASYYKITAVDSSGNESAAAVANAVRPSSDVTAPATPTGL